MDTVKKANTGFFEPCWIPVQTPENHAALVADEARRMILTKYERGQREHGGELWKKKGLIDMAIEEAVDQVIYLLTLRDQIAAAGITLGDLSE